MVLQPLVLHLSKLPEPKISQSLLTFLQSHAGADALPAMADDGAAVLATDPVAFEVSSVRIAGVASAAGATDPDACELSSPLNCRLAASTY